MNNFSCLTVAVLLAVPAVAQQGPIRMHFDMHVDPLPQIPLPQKMQVFDLRVGNMEWVLDQVEPLDVDISFLAVGEFGELLVNQGSAGAGAAVLRRLYDAGGQIGAHSHNEWRVGPFDWPSVPPGPTLDECRQSWQHNIDWVDAAILLAYGGSPPEPLATINAVKGSHLPSNEPDYHTLMDEFGIEVREPGPEEDYYGWYDHHIWHPFRPSSANYMGEDLGAPFVQVTQGAVIGLAGIHHGVMQDMTAANVKRQFLQLYVNWRFQDRMGSGEKVWCWGWGSHAHDFNGGSVSRADLVDVVAWLDTHFAARTEPSGSDTMVWSTHQATRDAYLAWEAAHPGVSSFSFDSLTVDWSEYPWLRPVAEEMTEFAWLADLSPGSGVEAYLLEAGTGDAAVIAWTDGGDTVVDLSAWVGPAVRVVGLETGTLYAVNNPGAVEVGGEPVIVTERGASCPAPQNYCVSLPNSSGAPAAMSWSGVPGVGVNNFSLVVTDAAAGQFGIFYYGAQQVSVPFGNGFRCVGGSVFRLPVITTNSAGGATYALDLTAPPQPQGQIEAGQTWNFQFWFRDPPAGGAGFDLSDGLQVGFCP